MPAPITPAARQARATTDPRFTELGDSRYAGSTEADYTCRGCGKRSNNGGAFGFHVRACKALDALEV